MIIGNVWEYLYENNDILYLKFGISKFWVRRKRFGFKCKLVFYEICFVVVR